MGRPRISKTVLSTATVSVLVLASGNGCASGPPVVGASPSVTGTLSPTASTPVTATPVPAPSAPFATPAPSTRIVLSRVAYGWRWPNADGPARITHTYRVPPVPELVQIGVGDHSRDPGERPYNRISFVFTTVFPSYRFEFVDQLTADPGDEPIALGGQGVLEIVFTQAQAHIADGSGSSIVSQPARRLGLARMVDYARAGDFEGVLTYGVGIAQPIAHSNPQFPVRVYEVERVGADGRHLYTVAFDVDATAP